MSKGLHLYDIIRRPVITEKSHMIADENNQYVFEVDMRANKIQIKEAVEVIFDVDVIKVNTMVMPTKKGGRMRGRRAFTRSAAWKKAVVTVPQGQSISLFNV